MVAADIILTMECKDGVTASTKLSMERMFGTTGIMSSVDCKAFIEAGIVSVVKSVGWITVYTYFLIMIMITLT